MTGSVDEGDRPDNAERSDLAALVEKPWAESAVESLREEGVYDAERSVAEHDEGAAGSGDETGVATTR